MQRAQCPTNESPTQRRWLPAAACTLLMAALSACGGGMSMSSMSPPGATATSCTAGSCGMVMMTVTDAAGAFLSYKVNLVSLQLKKSDGTLVETLPVTPAVPSVHLINPTPTLTAQQIPAVQYPTPPATPHY